MVVRSFLPTLLGAFLWIATAGSASAEDRVPLVPPERLPAVGTCAPIGEGSVTHVLVAPPGRGWWFRVAGVPDELTEARLVEVLTKRAGAIGASGRSEHAVWITAAEDYHWANIVKVALACDRLGIYRIGLRVRSDSSPGVFGFPLFLPPPRDPTAAPTGRATGLDVRLQTVLDSTRIEENPPVHAGPSGRRVRPSNPALVYTAAHRAVERHGTVVATARLATNATVKDALLVLDSLYRAGCVGVRLPMRTLVGDPRVATFSVVWVNKIVLGDTALPSPPPPIAPRAEPWGLHGANRPDWISLDVVDEDDVEAGGAGTSWLGEGRMPTFERERAGAGLAEWGSDLGAVLGDTLRGKVERFAVVLASAVNGPEPSLVLRERLVREGAGLDGVQPTSVQATLRLERAGEPVARVEALVHIGGGRAGLVWMRWVGTEPIEGAVPAAEGTPADLRLFLEGELIALRSGGSAACTWADPEAVLRGFPDVARASIERLFATRVGDADRVRQELQNIEFDRVTIRPGQASAALRRGDRVVGVAYIDLVAEGARLTMRDFSLRRAD